ncbi:MAG: hypothetical protein M3Z50_11685 [Actinomycetota bacterium]|nr:hypothetical protein [Actinomycetota bacterium]
MRVDSQLRYWHVTVTVSGQTVEPKLVRSALVRLSEERPFMTAMSFADDFAEIEFWDEGESMLDVASLALRMWDEHRGSASLPQWEVVGLQVLEKDVWDCRRHGQPIQFRSSAPAPRTY